LVKGEGRRGKGIRGSKKLGTKRQKIKPVFCCGILQKQPLETFERGGETPSEKTKGECRFHRKVGKNGKLNGKESLNI